MRQSRRLGIYNTNLEQLNINELAAYIAIQIFDKGSVGYYMGKARNKLYLNNVNNVAKQGLKNFENMALSGVCDCSSFITTIWAFAYILTPDIDKFYNDGAEFYYTSRSEDLGLYHTKSGKEFRNLEIIWMREHLEDIEGGYVPHNEWLNQDYWNACTRLGAENGQLFHYIGNLLEDTILLQPGDIIQESYAEPPGHALMYIGEYKNFKYATIECGGAEGGISKNALKIKQIDNSGAGYHDKSWWKREALVYRNNYTEIKKY